MARIVSVSRKFIGVLSALARDEGGQATVEYILILGAAVVGASTLARGILRTLDDGVLTFGAQLERDLKTGRAPASVWIN